MASTGALIVLMLLLNLYLKVHIQFALANEDFELLFIKEYLLYISSSIPT